MIGMITYSKLSLNLGVINVYFYENLIFVDYASEKFTISEKIAGRNFFTFTQ